MLNFAISDHGIIEAKTVPDECFGPPGQCPPGTYHTLYRHNHYVGLLEKRLWIFAGHLQQQGFETTALTTSLFNAHLIMEMLRQQELLDKPAKIRAMYFDEPLELTDGKSTHGLMFAVPAESPGSPKLPFRCAVAQRRRPDQMPDWDIKRLGRHQADEDLAAARERGFDDVLYLDRFGCVCEASYANVVAVFGNRVCRIVAPGRFYPGVTSRSFELIKKHLKPLQVHDATMDMAEIARADEVFLTSAVRGLQPVTEIEGVATWQCDYESSACRRISEILLQQKYI